MSSEMTYKVGRNARVLLINCPVRTHTEPTVAPLGVAILGAVLRENGADVSILDLNAYRNGSQNALQGPSLVLSEAHLSRHINRHGEPRIIGISGMITTLRWQMDLLRVIRKVCPKAYIVSGGGLATEFGESLFVWMSDLDAVVVGEGEVSILQVCRDVNRGKAYKHAVYIGERVKDLDSISPPAWDLLSLDHAGEPVLEKYIKRPFWGTDSGNCSSIPFHIKRNLNTVSSRGCPHSCGFCFHNSTGGRRYGTRSAESLTQEFRGMRDSLNIDFIGVLDDNFMSLHSRVRSMAGDLGRYCRSEGLRWGCHSRLDDACRAGLADKMAEAGCVYIGFGGESASTGVLRAMGKYPESKLRQNVSGFPTVMEDGYLATIKAGIHANLTWMMGYPGETLEDLKKTIRFILWQSKHSKSVNRKIFTATAYPGTPMFKDPDVMATLSGGFGLSFKNGTPVMDKPFLDYCLSLDDATKLLTGKNGPVFFAHILPRVFQKARELVDAGNLEAVLSL